MTAMAGLGCQIVLLHNKSCIGLFEAENGRETRVHQVNNKLCFERNINLGFYCSRNSDDENNFCENMCLVE